MEKILYYLISWTIVTQVLIPCPQVSTEDEFGRTTDITFTCAVAHFETKTESKEKRFYDKDSAYAFFNRLNSVKNSEWGMQPRLTNRKIDSIYKQ